MAHEDYSPNCCDWTERPVFQHGQRLTPERLNRIHEHFTGRMRHALLGIAGPGVVYGFQIETDDDGKCRRRDGKIYVSCGLALDRFGRQLLWKGGWLSVDDTCGVPPECEGRYTLSAHYAEFSSSGDEHCGCDESDADWIQEGVVFTLTPGCERVNCDCPDHCEDCISLCDYVCSRLGSDERGIPVDEHLRNLCKKPGELCNVGCDDWRFDYGAGLPLACIRICRSERDLKDCGPEYEFCDDRVDVCGFRQHVYRNSLLFELIKGCHVDLGRVADVSFRPWVERGVNDPVSWQDFADAMRNGVTVTFDRPVATRTLHKASIFMTAIIREKGSFFSDVQRFPVERMVFIDEQNGFARGVELQFNSNWIDIQLGLEISRFNCDAPSLIELTVRCAMLRDVCECMFDGRPFDISNDKPGQEMPGDDFVVAFCVEPKSHDGGKQEKQPDYYTNQRQ